MSRHTHLYPDSFQLFFLAVCLFDLIFFVCYMLLYEVDQQSMISDTLFSTPEYVAVLCITLALRVLGAALFFYGYRNKYPFCEINGWIGIIVACFGWGYLITHQDNFNHFTGVALFCAGSALYSLAILSLARHTHEHLHAVHNALLAFLLVTTCILVVAFAITWQDEENRGLHTSNGGSPNAYIVEHVAYITHVLFYGAFFLFHSPDPYKQPRGFSTGTQEDEMLFLSDLPDVCRPLVPPIAIQPTTMSDA